MNNSAIKWVADYQWLIWLLSWGLLGGSGRAAAQATLHKDLKKDFGALGNGRTNDQAAFAKAADFFNQRAKTPAGAGRAGLHIAAGVYRVGQPGPRSLLAFSNCRNLTVLGADSATTEIRYADSLRHQQHRAARLPALGHHQLVGLGAAAQLPV